MTMRTRLTAGLARFPPFAGRASSRWEFTWFIALMVLSGACGLGDEARTTTTGGAVAASTVAPQEFEARPPPVEPPDIVEYDGSSDIVDDTYAGEGSWVLSDLPDGFEAVLVTDRHGRREIYYQHESNPNDLYDSPLVVVVDFEEPGPVARFPGTETVSIHDIDGILFELHGDGDHYGTAVVWQDDQGRWVLVAWSELVPEADVLELARGAEAIDDEQWSQLQRTLGSEVQIQGVVHDQVEYVVAQGVSSAGTEYRLFGLIPADYPLDDNDRRPACYRLDLGEDTGAEHCDDHPWWHRTGDDTFVFGPVDGAIAEIIVTHIDTHERPVSDTPVAAETYAASVPSPVAFYVVEVNDWCWVHITATDGTPDNRLGPIGPLPSNPHHGFCLAE